MTDPTPANLPAGAHDAGLDPVVLVAGATGLVGMAAAEHFAALPGWQVVKLRRAGFADCEDTEDSLLHWIARMQAERFLPR